MIGEIILVHLVGDYLLQSSWMARNKTARWFPAVVHGLTYTLPFMILTHSPAALLMVGGTHAVIDRLRAARYVIIARDYLAPPSSWRPWSETADIDWTNYRPWALRVIVDNTIHLLVNVAALTWL